MIVYGTKIKSDIDFPIALSTTAANRYTVELSAGPPDTGSAAITCGFPFYRAHGRHVYLYSDRLLDGVEKGQPFCYEVKDIVRFYWISGEQKIQYTLDKHGNEELLSFWFIHLLLPLFLTLEGMYDFLHAGAIEIEDKPVLLIAPSMGGKSTLTDHFIKQGHRLTSDDKVATFLDDSGFMAVGSHPYHRPYRKFEELGYKVDNYSTVFKPIHAFYKLEAAEADADISVCEINGIQKFQTLLPNYLYNFHFLKDKRLLYLSGMMNNVRVFTTKVPWDLNRKNEVYDAICKHSRAIE